MKVSTLPIFCFFGILFQNVNCGGKKFMVNIGDEVAPTIGTVCTNIEGGIFEVRIRKAYFFKIYKKSEAAYDAYSNLIKEKVGSQNRIIRIAGPWAIFPSQEYQDYEIDVSRNVHYPEAGDREQIIKIPVKRVGGDSAAPAIEEPNISIPQESVEPEPSGSSSLQNSSSSQNSLHKIFVMIDGKIKSTIFGEVDMSSRIIRIPAHSQEADIELALINNEINDDENKLKGEKGFQCTPFLFASQDKEYSGDDYEIIRKHSRAVFGVKSITLESEQQSVPTDLIVHFSWMECEVLATKPYLHAIRFKTEIYFRKVIGTVDFRNGVIEIQKDHPDNKAYFSVAAEALPKLETFEISEPLESLDEITKGYKNFENLLAIDSGSSAQPVAEHLGQTDISTIVKRFTKLIDVSF